MVLPSPPCRRPGRPQWSSFCYFPLVWIDERRIASPSPHQSTLLFFVTTYSTIAAHISIAHPTGAAANFPHGSIQGVKVCRVQVPHSRAARHSFSQFQFTLFASEISLHSNANVSTGWVLHSPSPPSREKNQNKEDTLVHTLNTVSAVGDNCNLKAMKRMWNDV